MQRIGQGNRERKGRARAQSVFLLALALLLCTAMAACRGRSVLTASELAGHWLLPVLGKTNGLAFEPQNAIDFRLQILGAPTPAWSGTLHNGEVAFSGLYLDGSGPRWEAKFHGRLFPLGKRRAAVISGRLTITYSVPGQPPVSVPAVLIRSRQPFTEAYWALTSDRGDQVMIGVVTDAAEHFVGGGFTGWPHGEGQRRSCSFLQCGGDVFDFRAGNHTVCFKTDASDAGCGGVAQLCLDAAVGTGMSWHLGCTREPKSQLFSAAGPFTRLDEVRFPGP